MDILRDIYNNGDYTDVTFVVEGRSVDVHRCVLSHCKYFDTLFKSKFYDGSPIKLEDINFDEFEQLVKFIYLGEIDINLENVVTWIHFAELYQIQLLREKCEVEFFHLVSGAQVLIEILPLVTEISFAKDLCVQCSIKFWDDIARNEYFLDFLQKDREFLVKILTCIKIPKAKGMQKVEDHDRPRIIEFLNRYRTSPKTTSRIFEIIEDLPHLCENVQHLIRVCEELSIKPPDWYVAKYL